MISLMMRIQAANPSLDWYSAIESAERVIEVCGLRPQTSRGGLRPPLISTELASWEATQY